MATQRRVINKWFLVSALAGVGVLGLATHTLHAYQRNAIVSALREQSRLAEARGENDKAIGYLSRYLQFAPKDFNALSELAVKLDDSAKLPREEVRAFMTLEKVLREDTDRNEIRRRLAFRAFKLKRVSDAQTHARDLLASGPADVEVEHLLGQCHEAMGEFEDAAFLYLSSIRSRQDYVESYQSLETLLRTRLQQPLKDTETNELPDWLASDLPPREQAIQVMDRLVETNQDSFRAFIARAGQRQAMGDLDGAAADLDQAARLAPDDPDTLAGIVNLALLQRRESLGRGDKDAAAASLDRAIEHARRGLEIYPDNTAFHRAMATIELESGNRTKAIEILRNRLAAKEDLDLLWRVAEILVDGDSEQELHEADALIRLLRSRGADRQTIDYLKGRFLVQTERWQEAIQTFQRIRQLLSKTPELQVQVDLQLAHCHDQLANPDLQLAAYRHAVSTNPSSVPARLGLASTLATIGRLEEAVSEYQRIMSLPGGSDFGWTPAVGWVKVAHLLVIRNLRVPAGQRDLGPVQEAIERALQESPDSVDANLVFAYFLTSRGEVDRASDVLEKARDRNPDEPRLWVALSEHVERRGDHAAAESILNDAVRKLGDSAALRLARASYWMRRGGEAALGALRDLEANPEILLPKERPQLLNGLGEVYGAMGATDDSKRIWELLAQQRPNDIRVRLRRFMIALGDKDEAAMRQWTREIARIESPSNKATGQLEHYCEAQRLISLARENPGSNEVLGKALAHLDDLAVHRPGWSEVPRLRGEVFDLRGNAQAAIENYKRAVELGQRHANLVRRLAQLLSAQRRFVDADQVIRQLEFQTELPPDLQRLAAAVSLQLDDSPRAVDKARQAAEKDTKDFRNHLWLGQVLFAAGKPDDAEVAFREAVNQAENNSEVWVALISCLTQMKKSGEAEQALQEAQSKLTAEEMPLFLAQCYEIMGRLEPAAEAYNAALEQSPESLDLLRSVAAYNFRKRNHESARIYFDKILNSKESADDLKRWARRSIAIGLLSRPDFPKFLQALKLLDENLAKSTDGVEDLRAKAFALATRSSHRNDAIKTLEELNKRDSLSQNERLLLAQLYMAARDWPKYRELMLGILAANPSETTYIADFAFALLEQKEIGEVTTWLEKLKQIDPNGLVTHEITARLAMANGKRDEATSVLREYAEQNVSDQARVARILEQLGISDAAEEYYRIFAVDLEKPERKLVLVDFLSRQNRAEEALDLCRSAWADCPVTEVAARAVTVAFETDVTTEQRQRVAGWIEKAVRDHPAESSLVAYLAVVRCAEGKHTEAAAIFRNLLASDGNNLLALNNLAWLLAKGVGLPSEADRLINRAIDLYGPLGELLDTRASVYLAMGNTKKAVDDLQNALAETETPERHLHLAHAFWLANNRPGAQLALKRSKELGLRVRTVHPLERPELERMIAELSSD